MGAALTYAEKISWLRGYREAVRRAQLAEDLVLEARTTAARITPTLSGMPGGGGSVSRLESSVEHIEQQLKKRDAAVADMYARKAALEAVIAGLKSSTDKELMTRRYVLGETWERVGAAMLYDAAYLMRRHHKIVQKLCI